MLDEEAKLSCTEFEGYLNLRLFFKADIVSKLVCSLHVFTGRIAASNAILEPKNASVGIKTIISQLSFLGSARGCR
ncbi:MAG: hypothetical protein PHN61_09145 [Methanothrix sp.]|nr:hypothetical protein [Methanothrix sp.]